MNHIKHVYDQRLRSDPLGGHLGWVKRLKFIFFQNMVMLNVKLKGIRYAVTWKQTFCQQSLPLPDLQQNTLADGPKGHLIYKYIFRLGLIWIKTVCLSVAIT